MPRRAARFRVRGLAPNDAAWRDAPPAVKAALMNAALAYVLKAKDQELAEGKDRHGNPLVPIRPNTKRYRISAMGPADPGAPPLMPAYATSRTRLWLTAKVVDGTTVEVSWLNDWGKVLLYHAEGKGRRGKRVPVRDVVGISPEAIRKARGWTYGWWLSYTRTGAFPQRKSPAVAAFRPLEVTGRTDFERFTYGIGSTSDQQAEAARGRALVLQGRTTGFRQRRPGQGLPAIGGPGTLPPRFGGGGMAGPPLPPAAPAPRPTPKPKPKPAPVAPRPPAPAPAKSYPDSPEGWLSRAVDAARGMGADAEAVSLARFAAETGLAPSAMKQAAGAYVGAKRKVYFVEENASFLSPADAAEMLARGWWSAGSAEGVGWHEAAHALHHGLLGDDYYRLRGYKMTDAEKATAATVSRYAATSAVEFVAEAFAGLRAGARYGADVAALYKRFKGPPLP